VALEKIHVDSLEDEGSSSSNAQKMKLMTFIETERVKEVPARKPKGEQGPMQYSVVWLVRGGGKELCQAQGDIDFKNSFYLAG